MANFIGIHMLNDVIDSKTGDEENGSSGLQ